MESDPVAPFGRKVKALRKGNGWSQEDLAEKAGLHWTYISGIERGKRNVALRNIVKIARALKVPISKLFEGI